MAAVSHPAGVVAASSASNDAASLDDARHIHGQGTPESRWRAWPGLEALPRLSLPGFAPVGARIVVVAPHPDDEVLGCGGALAISARAGHAVLVVGVTDGEGSHPGSARWTPGRLARTRCEERARGLAQLGIGGGAHRLRLADGGVASAQASLVDALRDLIVPGDVVLTTWRFDGHPDHEATGRAAVRVARERACCCWEMPVWMWHWARPDDPAVAWRHLHRLDLDEDARARKRRAIAAHATQLTPRSDAAADEHAAVLPDWALARTLRSFECFFDTGALP